MDSAKLAACSMSARPRQHLYALEREKIVDVETRRDNRSPAKYGPPRCHRCVEAYAELRVSMITSCRRFRSSGMTGCWCRNAKQTKGLRWRVARSAREETAAATRARAHREASWPKLTGPSDEFLFGEYCPIAHGTLCQGSARASRSVSVRSRADVTGRERAPSSRRQTMCYEHATN